MENVQRQVALGHPVNKTVDRRFVIIGGERRGQPQAERPGRRQRGTASELGITVQHVLRRWAVDDEIFQILAFYRLPVTHQRGKAFAQTIYRFPDTEIQALKHIVTPAVSILHVAVIFQLAAGNTFAVTQEVQRPELTFSHAHAQVTALQLSKFGGVVHLDLHILQHVQRVMRTGIQRPLEVLHTHTDHAFLR